MNPRRIEKKIVLKAPLARVWRALTDHREFGTWFHVALEKPFVAGRPTKGRLTHPGFTHPVTFLVRIIEPMTCFAYAWHPFAIEPGVDYSEEEPTLVEFRLQETARGTALTVTESGFENLPAARRARAFRMHKAGWTEQLRNIAAHVATA
jgi:uncharacterized protein YndB with AHSA1/START domain